MAVRHRRVPRRRWYRRLNPVAAVVAWVYRFERRGVYVPGEESRMLPAWQDFAWWFAAWMVTVGVFVVFFAVAG